MREEHPFYLKGGTTTSVAEISQLYFQNKLSITVFYNMCEM